MAAEAFIVYFEKLSKDIMKVNVQDFFKSFFSTVTPDKKKMIYKEKTKDSINQARNCIIDNLYRNPFFLKEDGYMRNSIESVYLLIKNTKDDASDEQIAQLIFLLHLSKANLDCKEFKYFEYLFFKINTIHLTTNENRLWFEGECNKLFDSLKNTKKIKNIINNVVKVICGKEAKFDYGSCNIIYFTSSIKGLNGFAGINQIYVSDSELENLYDLSHQFLHDDKLLILKLNLIRLILHEITHVVLRHTLNDFNISSPKYYENNHQLGAASVSCDASNLIEAGLWAEKKLFNGKIDWKKSAMSSKLNIEYCASFLNKLMI